MGGFSGDAGQGIDALVVTLAERFPERIPAEVRTLAEARMEGRKIMRTDLAILATAAQQLLAMVDSGDRAAVRRTDGIDTERLREAAARWDPTPDPDDDEAPA